MTLGVLTLATPNDYQKAIGLALSIRVSNPGLPIAVACSPKLRPLLEPYFDHVIDENPALRGFVHKVHLDRYSPFEETFFFDSDVLVFRPLEEIIDEWRQQPYSACGIMGTSGISSFGLDRAQVLEKIGKPELVMIDGAGHAYFRKPDCQPVFDLAREITDNYADYAGPIRYADEDVMNIVLTLQDLQPLPHGEFFSRYLSAKRGTVKMDATRGVCEFVAVTTNAMQRPHMMHFAANEAPFIYANQLSKLFKKFGVNTKGLWRTAIEDFYVTEIEWPFKNFAKKMIKKK